jgi:hypothetical protein
MRRSIRISNAGSTLLVTVFTSAILGIILASYLTLVRNQHRSVVSSQYYNIALPLVEAGIEEAITHINVNGIGGIGNDAWIISQNGDYKKNRTFDNATLEISIDPSSPPIIVSKASFTTPYSDGLVTRSVRCGTSRQSLFMKGMVAKGTIDLNGNNILSDSYNSSVPSMSGPGGTYDPNKRSDKGDVATNSGLINSLSLGNATIFGKVSTGPGGSIAVGPNGAAGSLDFHNNGNSGIQTGWSTDDMNLSFPDVELPFSGGGTTPQPSTVSIKKKYFIPGSNSSATVNVDFEYTMDTGDYVLSSFSSGNDMILVTGKAVLHVAGNFKMSGSSQIVILPGASLDLYVGQESGTSESTTQISGNGVANHSVQASSFRYWGLKTNTKFSVGGNAKFMGTVYAPYAAFTMNGGGGRDPYDFTGASITGSVQMNGKFQFHYDEDLQTMDVGASWQVTSWEEI